MFSQITFLAIFGVIAQINAWDNNYDEEFTFECEADKSIFLILVNNKYLWIQFIINVYAELFIRATTTMAPKTACGTSPAAQTRPRTGRATGQTTRTTTTSHWTST